MSADEVHGYEREDHGFVPEAPTERGEYWWIAGDMNGPTLFTVRLEGMLWWKQWYAWEQCGDLAFKWKPSNQYPGGMWKKFNWSEADVYSEAPQ